MTVGPSAAPPSHGMKRRNWIRIALLFGVMMAGGSAVIGQDSLDPMRLAPVEIEDVSRPVDGESQPSEFGPLELPAPPEQVPDRNAASRDTLKKPIAAIELSALELSQDVSRERFTSEQTRWITASELDASNSLTGATTYCRRRLYFEDASLERCGRSDFILSDGILTNVHSGAKFLIDTALWPYRMLRHHRDEYVVTVAK